MSEHIFAVGEVAIGQNFANFTQYNGAELTIVKPLDTYLVLTLHPQVNQELLKGYVVEAGTGDVFFVEPHQLRKKRPPTTGEDAILSLFKATPIARPELEVA